MKHKFCKQFFPIFLISLAFITNTCSIINSAEKKHIKGTLQKGRPANNIRQAGGPDCNGYTYIDSSEAGGPFYDFEDISLTGNEVVLSDDDVSPACPVGFNYFFYGKYYSNIYICSNGFITVDSSQDFSESWYNTPLPMPYEPFALIAGLWVDLNPEVGGNIHYQTLGTSPNRRFIVQFTNIEHYYNGNPVTFQIKIYESTGSIEVHYLSAPTDASYRTVGIEDLEGQCGLEYYYGTASLTTPLAVRFDPPAREINIREGSVSIPDGDTYNFGDQPVGSNTLKTFTIENLGISSNLALTGIPFITIDGPDSAEFNIDLQPTSPILPGDSKNFIVRYSPTSPDIKWATLHVENNDSDENPYEINLTSGGTPDIFLYQDYWEYLNNDDYYTPDTPVGSQTDIIFELCNVGDIDLSISNIIISGDGFSLISNPDSIIPPGNCSFFTIRWRPIDEYAVFGSISIISNDPYDNPFYLNLLGITAIFPKVKIINPKNNEIVKGTTNIEAIITEDWMLIIGKMEFFIDGKLVFSTKKQPYIYPWDTTSYSFGYHKIEAFAHDELDQIGSDSIWVKVDNPPEVTIVEPLENSIVFGMVDIKVTANDDEKIAKTDLFIDGFLKYSSNETSFTYSWDTSLVQNEMHIINAKAFDPAGQMGTDEVIVTLAKVNIFLNASRHTEKLWLNTIDYARIDFTIENKYNLPISKILILRKSLGSEYSPIKELLPSDLANNSYTYFDYNIAINTVYIYQIMALDASGKIVGLSNEKTLEKD